MREVIEEIPMVDFKRQRGNDITLVLLFVEQMVSKLDVSKNLTSAGLVSWAAWDNEYAVLELSGVGLPIYSYRGSGPCVQEATHDCLSYGGKG